MTDTISHLSDAKRELVAFRIGQQEFATDITLVREIRGWTPETPLPHAPSFVRGVINLRGTVLPIRCLAARLGIGASKPTARHVIIVVHVGTHMLGLLVDAASDILSVGADQFQATPEIGTEAVRQFMQGVLPMDGRMIAILVLDEVLPSVPSLAFVA